MQENPFPIPKGSSAQEIRTIIKDKLAEGTLDLQFLLQKFSDHIDQNQEQDALAFGYYAANALLKNNSLDEEYRKELIDVLVADYIRVFKTII